MQFKDYYDTLGVEATAGEAEIKTAYRRLARKYHPDVSKEAGAEERFKAINEAYEVLRDKEKRAAYDQLKAQGYRPGEEFNVPPNYGGGGGFDFEEVFFVEEVANEFDEAVAHNQIALHPFTAQIEVAIFEA